MRTKVSTEKSMKKLTLRQLRQRTAAKGLLTIRELARRIGCSRNSIYLAMERPSRYPLVFQKILEVIA